MEDFSKDDIFVLGFDLKYVELHSDMNSRLSYSTGCMLALLPPVNNIIITSCRFSLNLSYHIVYALIIDNYL